MAGAIRDLLRATGQDSDPSLSLFPILVLLPVFFYIAAILLIRIILRQPHLVSRQWAFVILALPVVYWVPVTIWLYGA